MLQAHHLFYSSTLLLPEYTLSLSPDQRLASIPFFPHHFPGCASACTCVCACVWKHNLGHYGGSCEKMWLKPSVNIAFSSRQKRAQWESLGARELYDLFIWLPAGSSVSPSWKLELNWLLLSTRQKLVFLFKGFTYSWISFQMSILVKKHLV